MHGFQEGFISRENQREDSVQRFFSLTTAGMQVNDEIATDDLFEMVNMASKRNRRDRELDRIQYEEQMKLERELANKGESDMNLSYYADRFLDCLEGRKEVTMGEDEIESEDSNHSFVTLEVASVGPDRDTSLWMDQNKVLNNGKELRSIDKWQKMEVDTRDREKVEIGTSYAVDIMVRETRFHDFLFSQKGFVDKKLFMAKIPMASYNVVKRMEMEREWTILKVGLGIQCFVYNRMGHFIILTEYGATFSFNFPRLIPRLVCRAVMSRCGDNIHFEFFDIVSNSQSLMDVDFSIRFFLLKEWINPILVDQRRSGHKFYCSFAGVVANSVSFSLGKRMKINLLVDEVPSNDFFFFFRDDYRLSKISSEYCFIITNNNLFEASVKDGIMKICRLKQDLDFCADVLVKDGRYLMREVENKIFFLAPAQRPYGLGQCLKYYGAPFKDQRRRNKVILFIIRYRMLEKYYRKSGFS